MNTIGRFAALLLVSTSAWSLSLSDLSNKDAAAGLKQALVARPGEFASAVAEKLLMYALGRNLQYYDAPAVRQIVREAANSHYTLASLVSGVVRSVPFQMRTKSRG